MDLDRSLFRRRRHARSRSYHDHPLVGLKRVSRRRSDNPAWRSGPMLLCNSRNCGEGPMSLKAPARWSRDQLIAELWAAAAMATEFSGLQWGRDQIDRGTVRLHENHVVQRLAS